MKYKIYLIEHAESKRKYVGWTTQSLKKRFYQHSKSKYHLGRSMREYGKDKFSIKELESFETRDETLAAEMKWISYYNSNNKAMGFNQTKGGDDSPIHRNQKAYKTKEFRKRMSEQAVEQHKDVAKKKNHVDGIRRYWDTLSEENKEARREIAKENGKLSKVGWNKGLKCPQCGTRGTNNPMAKTYLVTKPDGTTEVIKSLKTYCEANGLTYRNAQGVLEGKQAHHKNYKFARLEN